MTGIQPPRTRDRLKEKLLEGKSRRSLIAPLGDFNTRLLPFPPIVVPPVIPVDVHHDAELIGLCVRIIVNMAFSKRESRDFVYF